MSDESQFIKQAFAASAGRRSARFAGRANARGGGFISIVAGLEDKGLLFSKYKGSTFQGGGLQTDLAAANRRFALELSELTVKTMHAGLYRPRVSSGRLAAALADPQNRYSDAFGFGVGNPEWLDRSQAKYWRQIDQGFKGHRGRQIFGVFGDTLIGGGPNSRGVAGPEFRQIQHGFVSVVGGTGGRLLPTNRNGALRILRAQAGGRRGTGLGSRGARNNFSVATKGIIKNPIRPEQYFLRAWEEFNIKQRYMATVREIITASFGGFGIPTGANLDFMAGRSSAQPPPSRRFR